MFIQEMKKLITWSFKSRIYDLYSGDKINKSGTNNTRQNMIEYETTLSSQYMLREILKGANLRAGVVMRLKSN